MAGYLGRLYQKRDQNMAKFVTNPRKSRIVTILRVVNEQTGERSKRPRIRADAAGWQVESTLNPIASLRIPRG